MRQGQQNRRGRGRNNNNNNSGSGSGSSSSSNRKSQNPLTRSFESTGPDVKLRGTPSHVAEKYMSLARDALSSGDPVLAENYMQHAEHYNRIIMSFREQQISQGGVDPFAAGSGMGRPPRTIGPQDALDGDDFGDDEGDDFGGDAQPGATASEGAAPMQQPRSFDQPPPQQRFDNNRPQHNNQNQHRNDHRPNQHQRHDRNDRNDNRFDRQDRGDRFERNDRGGPDRNQDRGNQNHDRGNQNQDRGPRHDRSDFNADRSHQNSDRSAQRGDRNGNVNGGEQQTFRDDRPGLQPQPLALAPIPQQAQQPAPPLPPQAQPQPQVSADGAPPEGAASHRRRERFQNQIRPAAAAEPAVAGPAVEAHQPDFLRRPVRRPRREEGAPATPRAPATPAADDKE